MFSKASWQPISADILNPPAEPEPPTGSVPTIWAIVHPVDLAVVPDPTMVLGALPINLPSPAVPEPTIRLTAYPVRPAVEAELTP